MVGTIRTPLEVQADGKDGAGGNTRPLFQNDERERQFHLQLEQMRQQTELEQARMQAKKKPPASDAPDNLTDDGHSGPDRTEHQQPVPQWQTEQI